MKLPPPEKLSVSYFASFFAFAVVVALFLLVSSKAGMRGLGLSMLIFAGVQAITRRIPYGLDGHEPSGYITGMLAVMLSILMPLLGGAMLVRLELMLAVFGWDAK